MAGLALLCGSSAGAATLTFVSDTPEPTLSRPFRWIGISNDGRHVYAGSDAFAPDPAAVVVLSRDLGTGTLSFVELEATASYFENFVESPDGEHVYLNDTDVQIYDRNTTTGELTFVQSVAETGSAESMAFSPDGLFLHVSWRSGGNGGVSVYARDAGTGALSLVDQVLTSDAKSGQETPSLLVSSDGLHLYWGDKHRLRVFERNATTGALDLVQQWKKDFTSPSPIATSPDGTALYARIGPDTTVFARDPVTGKLTFMHELGLTECEDTDVDTHIRQILIDPASSSRLFSLHIDEGFVTTGIDDPTHALATLDRLSWAAGDLGAIGLPRGHVVSPAGDHVYIATLDRTIALYSVGASPSPVQKNCLLEGRSFSIKSAAGGLKKSAKVVSQKEYWDLPFGVPGTDADPTCNGDPPGTARATIRFLSTTTGEDTGEIDLPCERWTATGKAGSTSRGYQYKDPQRADGPCKTLKLQGRKLIKAICDNKGAFPFDYDLTVGVDQGIVEQVLTIGNTRYCMGFDDHNGKDGSDGKKFLGKNAPAPAACP